MHCSLHVWRRMFHKLTKNVSQFHMWHVSPNWTSYAKVLFSNPIGLLVFAISLLCNYFKVAAVLPKRCRELWCSIQKKYHPKSAIKDNNYSTELFFNNAYWPFWKPATMADTGTISHASISENVQSVLIYMYTNLGAFITKWTIGLICRCTKQLTEQHNRYIKAEVDGYVRPSFLCTPENKSPSTASGTAATVSSKKKCCCSVCDGKGHVQPGKNLLFLRSIVW